MNSIALIYMMTTFWYNDIHILLDRPDQFIPSKDMSLAEQLNAITRFSIYYTILILLFNLNRSWIYLSVCLVIMTLLIWSVQSNQPIKSPPKFCQEPTYENPYMNIGHIDYYNPNRLIACKDEDIKINQQMQENLYENETDLQQRHIIDLAFYTQPNTTIPNDQIGFAKWLYNKPSTCKENGSNCISNIDLSKRNKQFF